ncbi:cation-translocating P-type ATPase [Candidatus Saccharibacteria bacterium]|nr:cation-translocating P-type ATPase [Candidatus Saccharibacteria bacterium]
MKKSVFISVIKDFGPIILRNVFSLVAIIIGGLSIILIVLGNTRDGVFLGTVILINIILGIVQELRSRIALEKLQASTAQVYDIMRASQKLHVYSEQIQVGDKISLSLGDQVPVDSVVRESEGCEFNEALLSGESDNINKSIGDKVLAGSIIVAGAVVVESQKIASESYLATMTQDLKHYNRRLSPIQKSILRFIQIMAGVLAIIAMVILLRTFFSEESLVNGVVQISAVASTIIAEGLLLASTAFFVYGAVKLARKEVLLQQINAIENLGRVGIVCVDKTGTLTENEPVFEELLEYSAGTTVNNQTYLRELIATYVTSESAHTATVQALKDSVKKIKPKAVSEFLPFSSARKYSALQLKKDSSVVVVGASDYFTSLLPAKEKQWVESTVKELSRSAKRVLFVGQASGGKLDDTQSMKGMRVVGLIVLSNPLKVGTKDTINFLQKRKVQVVVISGDNPHTVRAIAQQAGILSSNKVYSGTQVEAMSDHELVSLLRSKPLFARILPSQKQRIVAAAQVSNTLVAMIGDGANDALAIKKADVGIAMFSGAPATRQIADAVLLNDSFSALPSGVELSDSIITTLEMVACLFFSRVWAGVLLLVGTLVVNIDYPFSPRNITLLNLFIIGFPLLIWSIWPRHRVRSITETSFLSRTLPFSIVNALLIATFSFMTYLVSSSYYGTKSAQAAMMTYLVFLVMSVFTISIIPPAMQVVKNSYQQRIIWIGFVGIACIVVLTFIVPGVAHFFSLQSIGLKTALVSLVVGVCGVAVQYFATTINLGNRLWQKILFMYHSAQKKNAHTT